MAKIQYIEGIITLTDGTKSSFSIARDAGWQQWGAVQGRLGQTVDALQVMAQALAGDDLIATSDDEDE